MERHDFDGTPTCAEYLIVASGVLVGTGAKILQADAMTVLDVGRRADFGRPAMSRPRAILMVDDRLPKELSVPSSVSQNVTARSQAVDARLTRAAIFLVVTIGAGRSQRLRCVVSVPFCPRLSVVSASGRRTGGSHVSWGSAPTPGTTCSARRDPRPPQAIPPSSPRRSIDCRLAGVEGPYRLVLGDDPFTAISGGNEGGYPVLQHIRRLVDGEIVLGARHPRWPRADRARRRFQLDLGQDLSIGYLSHTDKEVELYLQESFTFRMLTTEAAIALPAAKHKHNRREGDASDVRDASRGRMLIFHPVLFRTRRPPTQTLSCSTSCASHLASAQKQRDAASRLVEFKSDSVYAVRRDPHAAGVRLRQFQNQEHRTGYAKRTERRHGDGRAAGF